MSVHNGASDPEALREEIQRTRAELGETVQALAARADVKARVRQSAEETRARVRQSAEETRARVRQRLGLAGERMREQTGQVRSSVYDAGASARRNPAPWAVVALGALAAAVVLLLARGRRR
ncbi:MAG TPA: DUF3618 domain-containing protein [Micromonospora sp.]